MAENRGVAPPNMATPVGQVRALLGDLEYTEYDPPQPGFGKYKKMSDAEIESFLALSDGSSEGAVYYAYLSMASDAAIASKTVKDFDLQIDNTKRAADLRLIAQMWLDKWNAGSADIFELFDTVTHRCRHELAEGVSCRRGCRGSGLL